MLVTEFRGSPGVSVLAMLVPTVYKKIIDEQFASTVDAALVFDDKNV